MTQRSLLWRIGKVALLFAAALLVIVVGVVGYFVWPRTYARTYTESQVASNSTKLADLANKVEFRIGAAVHDTEVGTFATAAGHDFNSLTPANALKWGNLVGGRLGNYDFTEADALVDLALRKGQRVRGHALVWGRFPGGGHPSDLEERLRAAAEPKLELERLMEEHIRTVLEHFRGKVSQWDVVNEPLDFREAVWDESVFYRTLGPDFVAKAFTLAHAVDPKLELVLNEQLFDYEGAHADKFFDIVKHLRDTGVPIHGVGFQSHVIVGLPNLDALGAYMRRFTELGLFVEITELDARLRQFNDSADPYAEQGRFYHRIASICVQEPACRGITVWGISDRFTWLDEFAPFKWMQPNDPLLFDHDMRRKPAYQGVVEALERAQAVARPHLL